VRTLLATLAALLLTAAPALARSAPVQLGTALNSGGIDNAPYVDALRRYDAVTPESALKFAELHPDGGRYDFAFGDRLVDWSVANRKPMHGTTLIWCYDAVLPQWLLQRSWTRDELIDVMQDHIRTVMDHFEGRVPAWDVVNEAFARDGARRDCLWQRVIGDAWIELALRAARAADSSAKLFYNETAADQPNAKFGAVEAIAADFKARGVPLDGVGLQYHLLQGDAPLQFLAEDAMRRIGALGLALHVSELDGITSTFTGTREQKLDRQAQAFQTVAAACQAVDACFRITLWGAADHWSWRGTGEMAVALDEHFAEKPGWAGIREAIRPAPLPAGQPPSAPGRPLASRAPNAGVFTVSWPASWDPEGAPVNYALEHRDADDAAWSPVASGVRGLGFSFAPGRLERQGTYRYRVRASDGSRAGVWSEEAQPIVVDRADPAPPAITPDRAPDGGGWYRDRVTLTFAGAGDPVLLDGSAGSGVDPSSVPAPSSFASTGAHTVSGIVLDRAGNASRSATATVQVDAAAPQASLACPQPVAVGEPASATWTASDAGSGLVGPANGSLPLDSSRAGTFTARYEAADVAGHRTPATCQYVVGEAPDPDPEPSPEPTASATPTATATGTPTPEPDELAGAGTAPPQQGGPATDAAAGGPAPAVRSATPTLRRASRVGRDGRMRLMLRCPAACSGRLSLRAQRRTLAARRFRAAAGQVRVVLRLAKRDRRALARKGRLAVRLAIAPDGAEPVLRRLTLRR